MWSISGTALILGFMVIVGVIKIMESEKLNTTKDDEIMCIDEEGLLLEPSKTDESAGYGATTTLLSHESNSF